MTKHTVPLHFAGVGASAGGLGAMLPMFASMPVTGRIAVVVAQHMAKDGYDELAERLMNRESALPVVLASADEKLAADRVYVIPSVNTLFSSIAETGKGNAIGIVLSGSGYDGTAHVPAIPAEALKTKLDQLKHLLEESDSEAGELLSDLLDKLGSSPLAKQLKPVAAAIEGFDFDEALEKLGQI